MSLLDVAQLGLIVLVAGVGVGWFIYESSKDNNK
jgi:hypothetical protein